MRIIFIGHSGWEYPHTRVRCYGFAKALKKIGFETEVLSFKDHLRHHFSEEDMYSKLRDRDKADLVCQALRRLWPKRGDLFIVQKAHFHAAAPWLLSRWTRAKYVFDYDDFDIPLSNFFSRGRWNRLFFGTSDWAEITHRLARNALGCVAGSQALEEYLKPFNPKVARIETGVDDAEFYPVRNARKENAPLTFFWNGIVWGDEIVRSVRMAIDSFAKVHRRFPHTRLLIVGGGFKWQALVDETLFAHTDVPITFRGWMPPEAMPAVLREADVGILPFAYSTQEQKQWFACKSPTKLFEYLASGLSVIAWNLGEAARIIREGENGFLASDQTELEAQMLRIAEDPRLHDKVSKQARKTVEENYSHQVLGRRLGDFIVDLLG